MMDFPKHNKKDAFKYSKYRWWLGIPLGDLIDRAASVFPEKEALVDDRNRVTYRELQDRVNRLAVGLMGLGIKSGDTVLLQIPNWAEYVYSYFALQKIGAIPVVLISGYKQLEVGHLGRLTEAKAWIVPGTYRKMDYTSFIEEVRAMNPQLEHVISVRAEKESKAYTDSVENLMDRRLKERDLKRLQSRRPKPTAVAHIIPSGGTTGLPKGIPRTHNDYLCNVEYKHKGWEMNTSDVCLIAVPVGHNLAVLQIVGGIFFAFKLVLLDSTRPEDIMGAIEREKVTYMPTVPSLVRRMIQSPEFSKYNLSSLKKISAGGEPSTPELIREVYEKLNCIYINEFGMTEGLICRTSLTDSVETICNTVGKPTCPYNEVKILDPYGNEVPYDTDGELSAKGPTIFAGYLKNPEENRKCFTKDGFFRTGDQARMYPTGYIKITGRIKDLIIRGGENISPVQVEELLCAHPDIADAAVIGMPDRELGERVCAYIKIIEGKRVEVKDIVEFMERKGASKLLIPERFEFVENLPLTEAGKHDKKALRKDIARKLGLE
ncbi:MAG: AMP-binding protein [Syntrophorhabdaceae bacterium]|nr:AMP-binding protein [Syntrophorhabdaceae bacterium]